MQGGERFLESRLDRRYATRESNAYARYEQGKSVPTVEKLNELMRAIDSDFDPILKVA